MYNHWYKRAEELIYNAIRSFIYTFNKRDESLPHAALWEAWGVEKPSTQPMGEDRQISRWIQGCTTCPRTGTQLKSGGVTLQMCPTGGEEEHVRQDGCEKDAPQERLPLLHAYFIDLPVL